VDAPRYQIGKMDDNGASGLISVAENGRQIGRWGQILLTGQREREEKERPEQRSGI
jgi:hypothetical protein